jgi:hypothetical protein
MIESWEDNYFFADLQRLFYTLDQKLKLNLDEKQFLDDDDEPGWLEKYVRFQIDKDQVLKKTQVRVTGDYIGTNEKIIASTTLDEVIKLYDKLEKGPYPVRDFFVELDVVMNEEILTVILAVLSFKKWVHCDSKVDSAHKMFYCQGKDWFAQTEYYYNSLILPTGMKKNRDDFERILAYQDSEKLEILMKEEIDQLGQYRFK